jgi:hypothetical protein
MKMDYWAEHANNKWLFGHKLWNFIEQISHLLSNCDSWEYLLMKIIKVNIYSVVSNFVDYKTAAIPLDVLGSERGSQIMLFP